MRITARQRNSHVGRGLRSEHEVKLAMPPASVVVRPDVGLTTMPALSLSMFVGSSCWSAIAAYIGSDSLEDMHDDVVRLVPVCDRVVHTGHCDGLRYVPVLDVNITLIGSTVPSPRRCS
ncbi:MAG: hypothetical protein IPK60_16825 [Sandaracinaceae bacterium]|nr:hypothetical protein [Sandaracinaceae bacterium]